MADRTPPAPPRAITGLFDRHAELRAVIDAVLDGTLGGIASGGEPPGAARLSVGCYEIFGGDPLSAAARRLAETAAAPRELVYGNDPGWRRLLLDVHRGRARDRPMQTFDPGSLNATALHRLARSLPAGFGLRPFDLELASRLDAELEPHALQVFPDARSFCERGIGFAAVADDGRLACAATSYTVSSRAVEVAIATRPAFRGRGLAAAVSAALMADCLERGLVPHWSASNPVSRRLALRLGYLAGGTCEVLLLAEP